MKRGLSLLLLSAALVFPVLSFASENDRTLTVRASASIEAAPDTAIVTLAVETMALTARESAAENARVSDTVIKSVRRALGPADEIDTAAYSVFPVYEFDKGRREILKGFRTVHQMKVSTAKASSAGGILDKAMEAGANRIVDVRFDIRDITTHCEGLIRSAAAKATAQAKAASSAFGAGLGGIKAIVPSCNKESEGPMPVRLYAAEAMRAAPDTPLEPGMVRLRADVEAVYFLGAEE